MKSKKISVKKLKNTVWFKLFSILKLPLAFITNLRIIELNNKLCHTKIKYSYINKNPFNSTYFAALSMGAELASGVLAALHIEKSTKQILFIVTSITADFKKKALGTTIFKCEQGQDIFKAINSLSKENDKTEVSLKVIGYNNSDEIICEFTFNWSFKLKN
jgi:alkyl hydroperoxide reductase subunit AhpF